MLKIAIITNVTKDIGLVTATRVAAFLRDKADVYMANDCPLPEECGVTYLSYEDLMTTVDIAVVIGGDGTLLAAASRCAKNRIPAIGINLGKVGFLTEVEVADVEDALMKILSGDYETEKRMLLKVRVNDENVSYHALNDVVISKPENMKLVNVDLFSHGDLIYRYCADGLIIATPTGSTGYSISAGGPVVDPKMSLYIATPICAHMLSARSAVLSADRELVIKIGRENPNASAIITTDGERQRFISVDDEVHISKSDYEFELIKIGNVNFYKTLMNKL